MNITFYISKNVWLGLAFLIFGALIQFMGTSKAAFPDKSLLTSATGRVQSVHKGKSSIKFGINGSYFQFLSKSSPLLPVHDALAKTGESSVTVLYDPKESWKPPLDDTSYYTVYELQVAGKTLVSYEQVKSAWRDNDQLGSWLGIAFMVVGAGLILFSRRKRVG